MKSIKLVFEGGLGNQLFQLAYGLHLQEKYKCKVSYDISKYKTEKEECREFELDAFGVPDDWERRPIKKGRIKRFGFRYIIYLFVTFLYFKLRKAFRGRESKIDKYYSDTINFWGVHRIHNGAYRDPNFSLFPEMLIYGHWFWTKVALEQQDALKRLVVSKRILSPTNLDMLNRIKSSNSVGVHIRRGDYVALGKIACPIEYYEYSINEIAGKVKDAVFFIFSDDINWVKQNLNTDKQVVFVDNNNDTVDDFTLFSSCSHFILSNSTFSWWGAFLGKETNKIVLAPICWNPDNRLSRSPLVLDNWVKVDNTKFFD